MTKLAIIGTAGRKEDKPRLTHEHYDRMLNGAVAVITHLQVDLATLRLISGGAAWADHVAVTLKILMGLPSGNLTVYLPACLGDQGFWGATEAAKKTADTANYYHREFSRVTGHDSIGDLVTERNRGAVILDGTGNFFARNADVAASLSLDDHLLAYTFGNPISDQPDWTARRFPPETTAEQAGLKDGGTAHTFNLAKCTKWHLRLGDL